MSRLLCLSIISGACSSPPVCGDKTATVDGLTATGTGLALTFGPLTSRQNNDCPVTSPPPPAGLISLTIDGPEVGGSGFVTFCVGRPDQLDSMALSLGTGVHVVDLNLGDASCMYAIDTATAPTGTAQGHGVCGDGSDAAGFGLVLDGSVSVKRTCGTTIDTITVQLAGDVAVTPQ